MWSAANEEVRSARRALLQAAEMGPVIVRFAGRSPLGPMYQVMNYREDASFSLEALRRAALISRIRFALVSEAHGPAESPKKICENRLRLTNK